MEKASTITLPPPPLPSRGERPISPARNQPRHRPLARAVTSADMSAPMQRRRSSIFSENLSETGRSLRESTDDLLLPRVSSRSSLDQREEPSNWHSVPLALALLPALGGLFFKDGSAIITDLSLLGLAAIFLNWSIRLPWDWYKNAQSVRMTDRLSPPAFDSIPEEVNEDEEPDEAIMSSQEMPPPPRVADNAQPPPQQARNPQVLAAEYELHVHELLALLSCFVFPLIGAWLLHAIRAQLSRPSEGLVSNYNLTIFLLAAEIRPISHLIKMVQARTLFLQRLVADSPLENDNKMDNSKVFDLTRRMEELEAHVANAADTTGKPAENSELLAAKTTAQVTADLRRSIQPELDALNRAVRRYEKRTTISALQTEARLQDLETRLKDVVVLAAAAQRNADTQHRNFIVILVNWACAALVIPVQSIWRLISLPSRAFHSTLLFVQRKLGIKPSGSLREAKASRAAIPRPRERKKPGP